MTHRTRTALAALSIGALALTGCSEDASSDATATASAGEAGAEEYCSHVADLNALGERVFADVPEDATSDVMTAAWQRMLAEGAATIDGLESSAPDQIAEDVPVFLDDLRARAATGESADPETAQAAEERIRAFEEENCPLGPDGSS